MATTEEILTEKVPAQSNNTMSAMSGNSAPLQQSSTDMVNNLYDKQLANQTGSLKAAYDTNLSNLKASQAQIDPTYNEKANSLSAQYEIARRNMAAQNNMNGLNSGAGSQMALAQNANYGNSMADIRTAQANAQAEAQRQMDLLNTQYQNDIANATADNDYKRAVALYNDYQDNQNQLRQQAEIMAKFGDFSVYAQLFGQEAADRMRTTWEYQNPMLAYQNGDIDAARYKEITGKNAPSINGVGGTPASSGGGGYYGGTPTPKNDPTDYTYDASKLNGVEKQLITVVQNTANTSGTSAAETQLINMAKGGNISPNAYNAAMAMLNKK